MSPQAIAHSGGQFENELEQLWSNEAVLRLDELHNAVVDGIDAAEVFKKCPSRTFALTISTIRFNYRLRNEYAEGVR